MGMLWIIIADCVLVVFFITYLLISLQVDFVSDNTSKLSVILSGHVINYAM